MDVEIRSAVAADLPALVRLLRELFTLEADFTPDEARQRVGLARLMTDPARGAVLVAVRGGAVIGMVTGQLVISTAEGAPSAWVEDMVVDARCRGAGVGGALLAAIERWAWEHGATRLQLLADRENAPALAFYGRSGWTGTQLVCLRRAGRS